MLQHKGMEGDASFVVLLSITEPNALQEMKTAANLALKVTLKKVCRSKKSFKFNKFNKGTTAALFPCPFAWSLLLAPEASHKHL